MFPQMGNKAPTLYHFPQLFDGDYFYDILSRFYAHSWHLSGRACSLELFGSTPNLLSSVTLPYRAELICHWLGNESKISPKLVRDRHSAWQYLQLGGWFRDDDLQPIMSAYPKPGRRKLQSMLLFLQRGLTHLRYCPACIIENRLRGNEIYWRQVHQLYGVKYCPIHGLPLLNSSVRLGKQLRRYIPAQIVFKDTLSEDLLVQAIAFNPESDRFYEAFFGLSKTILWLLTHGLELGTCKSLCLRYNHALGLAPGATPEGKLLRSQLLQIGGEEFLRQLYPGNEYESLLNIVDKGIEMFTPLEHALLITSLGCNSVLSDYGT